MGKQINYNATVVEIRRITPQLATFVVKPDDAGFTFTPGQYTVLGLKSGEPALPGCDVAVGDDPEKMVRRAYSISSGAHQETLEFYVSLVSSGELTPRLFNLQPGARLFVGDSGRGLFTLEQVPHDHRVLMAATGTGLAPYISMLRTYLETDKDRPLAVLHGARYSWDLGYRTELERLARGFPQFRYLPIISRPGEDPAWNGESGYIQHWLAGGRFERQTGFALDPRDTHVFLCGHPEMVQLATGTLSEQGFTEHSKKSPGNIHMEKYW